MSAPPLSERKHDALMDRYQKAAEALFAIEQCYEIRSLTRRHIYKLREELARLQHGMNVVEGLKP